MESLNHYSRLRCLRGFQSSGQILNVGNKGVRKTRRAHFRCYSVFKMCQIMPECPRHYQKGPSYYQMSQRDYQKSATYYQKRPRERTQLWLRRLPALASHFAFVRPFHYSATFSFSTTPRHCLTFRTLSQHFATHFGFVRPFQYPATFCSCTTLQHLLHTLALCSFCRPEYILVAETEQANACVRSVRSPWIASGAQRTKYKARTYAKVDNEEYECKSYVVHARFHAVKYRVASGTECKV